MAFEKASSKTHRPVAQSEGGTVSPLLRAQFSLWTWLLLGAVLQSAITLLPVSRQYLVLPTFAVFAHRLISTVVEISTFKPGGKGEILEKATVDFGRDPKSDGTIAVLILGFKCNHPLGILARGVQEIGTLQREMMSGLAVQSDEFGYLGSSSWLNENDGASRNELMTLFYFRSREDVMKFAHSESHRAAWKYWNDNAEKFHHLGISHEVYEAPAGSWEAIYINYKPSGILATTFKAPDDGSGEEKWTSPAVSAMKGKYFTHEGRVGRGNGREHDRYADTKVAYGSIA